MILGIGIDLVKNERIKELIIKYKEHFLNKVYTESEIEYCQKKAEPAVSFAARFAAKEALLKALGTGLRNSSWQDIKVENDNLGKPVLKLTGSTKSKSEKIGVKSIFLSISHEKDYSVAQVVLEGEK